MSWPPLPALLPRSGWNLRQSRVWFTVSDSACLRLTSTSALHTAAASLVSCLTPPHVGRCSDQSAPAPLFSGLVLPPGQPTEPLATDGLSRGRSVAVEGPGSFSRLGLSQAAFLQIQEASGLGARESTPLPATSDHLAACNLGTEPAAGFRAARDAISRRQKKQCFYLES
ncbi:uncharacterized protein LOC122707641 [Cervus elaphus]|uniref:uncharacterized protein LOC122707641 n=1 Tax=Cervus elaphus TaxID=9860 RepID=UPI001CC29B32|nr:uncharacterized protein LOC122707641 [Cervus elaphus]